MLLLLHAEEPLPIEVWEPLRRRALFACFKWDDYSTDQSVLGNFPLILHESEWKRLASWAEQLTCEALEAERELLCRPQFIPSLGLPRKICKLLTERGSTPSPTGPRVMRFDFHPVAEGWRISEVNSDVPGGFVEASGFTQMMGEEFSRYVCPPSPGQLYAEAVARASGSEGIVALVHATAHPDDREVMEYLAGLLSGLGIRVCTVSPDHLRLDRGSVRFSCRFADGRPDLLVRFFPAEWLANLSDPGAWNLYFMDGGVPVSNPGSALLLQSKRFPLLFDRLDTPMPTWHSLLPETRHPHDVSDLQSRTWVLKKALGRAGEEVAIPGVTGESDLRATLREIRKDPESWVAQRRFHAVSIDSPAGKVYPCVGVFTVDGRACGLYGRIARKPLIDEEAQDVAVLLQQEVKPA